MFHLLTAEDSVSNSYELSAEMDSIGSDRRRFAPNHDLASTYFDQRIPIPRDEGVSLLLKSNNRQATISAFLLVKVPLTPKIFSF